MTTDGYQYRPWGPWPSHNMPGPDYGQLYNYSAPSYMTPSIPEKPPLTHLQELTRVFPSPGRTEGSSDNDSGWGDSVPSAEPSREYCFSQHSPEVNKLHFQQKDEHVRTTPLSGNEQFCSTRECDSGFAPETKEDEMDSNFGKQECITDFVGERGLPGFHQAFGSTEIGRFSRTDFFRQPSPPPTTINLNEESRCKKVGRKPRLSRIKATQPRRDFKEERNEDKFISYGRPVEGTFDPVVPPYQAPQYSMGMYPVPMTYHDPYASYAYHERSYPRYPSYEYLRSFGGFPAPTVEHHSGNYSQPWQSPYNAHPTCSPWPSPSVHPLFRYEY